MRERIGSGKQNQNNGTDQRRPADDRDQSVGIVELLGIKAVNTEADSRKKAPEKSARGDCQRMKAAVGCNQKNAEKSTNNGSCLIALRLLFHDKGRIEQKHNDIGELNDRAGGSIGEFNGFKIGKLDTHQTCDCEKKQGWNMTGAFPDRKRMQVLSQKGNKKEHQTGDELSHNGEVGGIYFRCGKDILS